MERHANFIKEKTVEARKEIKCECRNKGNVYVITGISKEELAKIGYKIFNELQKGYLEKQIVETLINGETLRPDGAFGMNISGNQLFAMIYNGQDNTELLEKLKRAVELALNSN